LIQLIADRLMRMRCRRASSAFCSEAAISRCATTWPSLRGINPRVSWSASASGRGVIVSLARPLAIAGHSCVAAS